jgi:hypothetical protein
MSLFAGRHAAALLALLLTPVLFAATFWTWIHVARAARNRSLRQTAALPRIDDQILS